MLFSFRCGVLRVLRVMCDMFPFFVLGMFFCFASVVFVGMYCIVSWFDECV